MSQERLFRAIGLVGDDLIARADVPVAKKKPARWLGVAALAACCALAIGLGAQVLLDGFGKNATSADCAMPAEVNTSGAPESAETEMKSSLTVAEDTAEAAEYDTTATAEVAEAPADGSGSHMLGPLSLGMAEEEIRDLLGEPTATSNAGPMVYEDGSVRVCWFYDLGAEEKQDYNVRLELADVGEGYQLNEIMLWSGTELATAEGIACGSTEDEILAVYADQTIVISDGTVIENDEERPREIYTIGEGDPALEFTVENGAVTAIRLGTYFEEPPMELD